MDALRLDPVAMATYTALAQTVSQQLASASSAAAEAVQPQVLADDLGLIGAEFAARFTEAVGTHAAAMATAGQLVATYGAVLQGYSGEQQATDAASAAALRGVGEQL
ncbi:hypothetical protein [Nocardia stercoris]|uniref:PE family protein n=1 Tax=Nocardia stercoris TaxID=2483361 RepID=A0A3M2L5Z5_9NOCA|nr:hypothetical protein [Nocardia stercoris]RMI31963.1 hypothetical protein EBN03_16720 [Nocardia stercoris]